MKFSLYRVIGHVSHMIMGHQLFIGSNWSRDSCKCEYAVNDRIIDVCTLRG